MGWLSFIQDPNTQWVLGGTTLLGICSGVIGCFAYLRRQSLMGDALAHAALPGICIAFMITGTKSIFSFFMGALIAGIIATFAIGYITRETRCSFRNHINGFLRNRHCPADADST